MATALMIAEGLARSNPTQGTAEGCFDTCWGAAQDLINALRREGIAGRKVLLRGWRGAVDLPAVGNHREWKAMGPARWTHWVVELEDGNFVDMTARQFDRALHHPQVDRLEDLWERWDKVDGRESPIQSI